MVVVKPLAREARSHPAADHLNPWDRQNKNLVSRTRSGPNRCSFEDRRMVKDPTSINAY